MSDMKLRKLEKGKEKLVLEVAGETHTLLNLLRENAWKEDAKQAAYIVEHPYLSQPKIIIRAEDPKKVLSNAAQLVIDEASDFRKEWKRALAK